MEVEKGVKLGTSSTEEFRGAVGKHLEQKGLKIKGFSIRVRFRTVHRGKTYIVSEGNPTVKEYRGLFFQNGKIKIDGSEQDGENVIFTMGVKDKRTLSYEGRDISPFTAAEWVVQCPSDYKEDGDETQQEPT